MKISNFKRNSVLACALLAGLSGEMLGMFSSLPKSAISHVPEGITLQCAEQLRDACEKGNFSFFKPYLQSQAVLKYLWSWKGDLLALVVNSKKPDADIFRFFVERGSIIDEAIKKANKSESIKSYIENIGLFLEACKKGDLEEVKKLEQIVGESFNQKNYRFSCFEAAKEGETALYLAVVSGSDKLVAYMLENIKKNEAFYYSGCVKENVLGGLRRAILKESTKEQDGIIKAFIKNDFVYDRYDLIMSYKSLDVVKYMVEDCKVDIEKRISYSNTKLTTLLGLAAFNGRLDIVKYFVEKGAKVNCNNKDDENILELAINSQSEDVVKCLIEKGAEVPKFPLHSVVKYGDNVALFKLFIGDTQKIKKEQVLAIADDTSATILHLAVKHGRIEILSHLLEQKNGYVTDKSLTEALNKKDLDGCTPLHRAKNKAVVDILIKNGAEIDARNNNGQTPLQLAVIDKREDALSALIAKKADVNTVDDRGWTPLHYAADSWNKAVVELLIKHGASPHVKTGFLETPLNIAQGKNGSEDMVKLLAKHTNIWLYRFTSWLNDAALAAFGAFGTHALLHIDQKERPAYFKKRVLPSALAVLVTHILENVTRKNFSYPSYLQNEKTEKLACLAFGAIKNRFVTAKLGA